MHPNSFFLVPRQHGHNASLSDRPQRCFIGSAREDVRRVAELSLVGCEDFKSFFPPDIVCQASSLNLCTITAIDSKISGIEIQP